MVYEVTINYLSGKSLTLKLDEEAHETIKFNSSEKFIVKSIDNIEVVCYRDKIESIHIKPTVATNEEIIKYIERYLIMPNEHKYEYITDHKVGIIKDVREYYKEYNLGLKQTKDLVDAVQLKYKKDDKGE